MSDITLSLNYIRKTKSKYAVVTFYTARRQGHLMVADENIITIWRDLGGDNYLLKETTSWDTLAKDFAKMRIFTRAEGQVPAIIYNYHYQAAIVMRLAYTYRAYAAPRYGWKTAKIIENLLLNHQYDEAKAKLEPEVRPILKYPVLRQVEDSGRPNLESFFA